MSEPAPTTLAAPGEFAGVVGGSDFLAHAERADAPEAALALLAAVRARHPPRLGLHRGGLPLQ